MLTEIIETQIFTKKAAGLIKKRHFLKDDLNVFKRHLSENPDIGDIVQGTGGIRKVRLKSSSKGKSGGFRVCYYQIMRRNRIYLLTIYQKNAQENISEEEKKMLKEFANFLKEANK